MGNAASSTDASLSGYDLPTFAPAPLAVRQDQDLFESKLEHMFRARLAMVQASFAMQYPESPDAAVDWAAESHLSLVPNKLVEATTKSFSGATLGELAELFAMPLNGQQLPDARSLGVVRRNVVALHPDHRRERSQELYGVAKSALEQLDKLIISNRNMFAGLTDQDTTYRIDDVVLPASLRPKPAAPSAPKKPSLLAALEGDGGMDVDDPAAAAAAASIPVDNDMFMNDDDTNNAAITPEEREAIRAVMRNEWGETYIPSEAELREIKHRLRSGTLSMGARFSGETGFALPAVDLEARARALLLRDPDEIAQSGAAQTLGQGAITSSALMLPPAPVQPRFFQGVRVADRALTFAGDTYSGGTVSFHGGGGSGGSQIMGNSLARAYAPKAPHDLNVVVPLRPENNNDVLAKYEERALMYTQPLALSTIRLEAPLIINSAHNEARGDVAAARATGIASLRPGGNGGGCRVKRTTPASVAPVSGSAPAAGDDVRMEDVEEEDEQEEQEQQGGERRKRRS